MNITKKFLNNNFYAAERKNTNDSIKTVAILCYRTLGLIEKKGEVELFFFFVHVSLDQSFF